jgi:hypothetical protein
MDIDRIFQNVLENTVGPADTASLHDEKPEKHEELSI